MSLFGIKSAKKRIPMLKPLIRVLREGRSGQLGRAGALAQDIGWGRGRAAEEEEGSKDGPAPQGQGGGGSEGLF